MNLAEFSILEWYLLAIVVFGILLFGSSNNKVFALGERRFSSGAVVTSMVVLALAYISGLRTGIGDTENYILQFQRIPENWDGFLRATENMDEWGFVFVGYVVKILFGNNSAVYLSLMSLIALGAYFYFFYTETEDIALCALIYILAGFFVTGLNGVRQTLVGSVFIMCTPLIKKRKYIPFILICLALSTIHRSALVLIPMIFLLQIPAWGKGTFGLLLMAIVLVIAYPLFAGILSSVLEGSAYENYTYGIQNFTDGGANVVRVAVLAVPVVLAFVFRQKLHEQRPMFGICLNGAILNLIFMMLASIRSWIFARFCFYFNHFSIVLLVWCIASTKKNKMLLYVCCVAAYLVYFYFEMMSTIYLYS